MNWMTSETLLKKYLQELEQNQYDIHTVTCYENDLKDFYRWMGQKDDQAAEISGQAAADYLTYLMNEKESRDSTLNRKKISLGRYLQWLTDRGLDLQKAVIPFQTRKIERLKEPRRLKREEVDRLIQSLNEEYEDADTEFKKRISLRDSIMFELLFYHGLQIQELVALRTEDFDPEKRTIRIMDKKGFIRTERIYSDRLYRKLLLWMEGRQEFANRNAAHRDVLFLTKLGTPVSVKFLVAIFQKYKDLTGITQDATPLFLKHSLKWYAQIVLKENLSSGGYHEIDR